MITRKKNLNVSRFSAKGKKINENFPNLGKKDIESLIQKQTLNTSNEKIKFISNNPKSKKIESLKSNIFDTTESCSNTLIYNNLHTESSIGLKYSSTADWKSMNTEILYLNEKKSEKM